MNPFLRRTILRFLPGRTLLHLRAMLMEDLPAMETFQRHEFFYTAFRALAFNRIDGDYVEFGCWGGNTFRLAYLEARHQRRKMILWGVDSFAGLPAPQEDKDEHPAWREGRLATSLAEFHDICRRNGISKEHYRTIEGYYDQTLEKMSADDGPTDICLAYIDCDLYSSTKSVLRFLRPRLKHGMLIAFDDYYCWSATQVSGERRAMIEFSDEEKDWSFLPYRDFGWHGATFVVERAELVAR